MCPGPDRHDESWNWDESYTMPENLFIAYQRGAGRQYYDLAFRYLDDKTWFAPLARGENVLGGQHAYSYVNSLSSAMMAYMVAGSEMHLRAAKNAFGSCSSRASPPADGGPTRSCGYPTAARSTQASAIPTPASKRPVAATRISSSHAICFASLATPATATAWSA